MADIDIQTLEEKMDIIIKALRVTSSPGHIEELKGEIYSLSKSIEEIRTLIMGERGDNGIMSRVKRIEEIGKVGIDPTLDTIVDRLEQRMKIGWAMTIGLVIPITAIIASIILSV